MDKLPTKEELRGIVRELVIPPKQNMRRRQIYLPDKQVEMVRELGRANGIKFSEMLRRIIDDYVHRATVRKRRMKG